MMHIHNHTCMCRAQVHPSFSAQSDMLPGTIFLHFTQKQRHSRRKRRHQEEQRRCASARSGDALSAQPLQLRHQRRPAAGCSGPRRPPAELAALARAHAPTLTREAERRTRGGKCTAEDEHPDGGSIGMQSERAGGGAELWIHRCADLKARE